MSIYRIICVSWVFAVVSCDHESSRVVQRDGEPDYIKVDNDSLMDAAIQKAKDEIDTFRSALENPLPTQTYFSVKKPFPYSKEETTGYEHIWIQDVSLTPGGFRGTIGNEPVDTREVKFGDVVEIANGDISDWMIIDNNVLQGGYTIRVLRDEMSAAERQDFDASLPFRIDEAEQGAAANP